MLNNRDLGILFVRVSIGLLMLFHGISKLTHGVEGLMGLFNSYGLPGFFAYFVFVGEVLAPLMIIFGLWTRVAGALVAITMVVAVALVHRADLFLLSEQGGWALELQGLYLFGALSLCFLGSGKYALSKGEGTWD